MTKRVSEMTADEYATHKQRARELRASNPEKYAATRRAYKQSPAGKAAQKRYKAKRKDADPEAFRERERAYMNASNTRLKQQDYARFRALRNSAHARFRANRTPEQLELARVHARRKHWKRYPMSRAKVRETVARAKAALPLGLAESTRNDVIQNIMLAISDGFLRSVDVAAKAPEFLRAHNRQFDYHKVKSLDENIPGMKSTWVDALPNDAEHY